MEHLPSPFVITLDSACPQINENQIILDHQIQGGARHSVQSADVCGPGCPENASTPGPVKQQGQHIFIA